MKIAPNDEDVNVEDIEQTPKISHSKRLKAVDIVLQYFEEQGASVMEALFLRRLRDEAVKHKSELLSFETCTRYLYPQDAVHIESSRLKTEDENK
ncbi:hypothetical protein TNCV_661501 [Trichonephila clavipes]|nr:hypothetical protein TNCV_661501 [Trichonephila clavipes]